MVPHYVADSLEGCAPSDWLGLLHNRVHTSEPGARVPIPADRSRHAFAERREG
jgi:hypothetical protein